MFSIKNYKKNKDSSDVVLYETRIRYNQMCDKAECVNYFFDLLQELSPQKRYPYLKQMGKFMNEYYSFFKGFDVEQKKLIYKHILFDKNNISLIVGNAAIKPIKGNKLLDTLKNNIYRTFLKIEKQNLKT